MHSEANQPLFEGLPPLTALSIGELRLWLTQPLGIATQFEPSAHLTVRTARLIAGPATDLLLALHRRAPQPMRFAHDWRNLSSYDSAARQILTEWGLNLGAERVARVDVLLSAQTPSIVRMGTTVGQAALAVAGVALRVHYGAEAFRRGCEARLLKPHPGWRSGSLNLV